MTAALILSPAPGLLLARLFAPTRKRHGALRHGHAEPSHDLYGVAFVGGRLKGLPALRSSHS